MNAAVHTHTSWAASGNATAAHDRAPGGVEFDTSLLHGQFRLSRSTAAPRLDWPAHTCRGWALQTHPTLRVTRLCDEKDDHIGWILGFCITAEGTISPPQITLQAADIAAAGQRLSASLGGRYVLVLLSSELQRLYVDAAGSLALVYAQDAPIIASTPTLIAGSAYPWDEELQSALDIARTGLWYPAGLTPKRGVRRLLPNHFLDLTSWTEHRFWPNGEVRVPSSDTSATVSAVIQRLRFILGSVAQRFPLQLSLTAGRDSRMLLACAKPFLDKTTFFTLTDGTDVEGRLSARLAKRFKLQYQRLPPRHSDASQRNTWDLITGACVGGNIAEVYTTFATLGATKALLPGVAGEIGRANYGDRVPDWQAPIATAALLHALRVPATPRLLAAMQSWRDTIGVCDNGTLFDLLYIEQRVGAWAGPQHYGCDRYVACHFTPFTDHQVLRLLLDLPWQFRYQEKLADEVCRQAWPALLDYPFNEDVGFARHIAGIRRNLQRATRWLN
jgi:hypothetical protein